MKTLAFCLLLVASASFSANSVAFAEVIVTQTDDARMVEARAKAKSHLPLFLEAAAAGDLSSGAYEVKWAKALVGQAIDVEHIWVTVSTIGEDSIEGLLNNQPKDFSGAVGDKVTVPLVDVSDWLIRQPDGKMQGAWTLRVLLPELSPEDQAYYQSILLPLPN